MRLCLYIWNNLLNLQTTGNDILVALTEYSEWFYKLVNEKKITTNTYSDDKGE